MLLGGLGLLFRATAAEAVPLRYLLLRQATTILVRGHALAQLPSDNTILTYMFY
jgi:hypothetical protein